MLFSFVKPKKILNFFLFSGMICLLTFSTIYMASSLLMLLDDIATGLDDVAAMTKVAAKKTAGRAPERRRGGAIQTPPGTGRRINQGHSAFGNSGRNHPPSTRAFQ